MADKALAIGFALGTGLLLLFQWSRAVRWDILFLLLLAFLIVTIKDRVLAVFAGLVLISYLFQVPRSIVSTRLLLTVILFSLSLDRLGRIKEEKFLYPILAIAFSCSVVGMYHSITKNITPFAPIGNQIIAGPMYAITSVLAYPRNRMLALWFAVVSAMSTSTTAILCLVAAYTPVFYKKTKEAIGFHALLCGQAFIVLLFAFTVDKYHSFAQRIDMIATTIEYGKERLFGWGLGSFYAYMPSLLGPVESGQVWGHAHNDILQLFFETGYLTFGVAVLFILRHAFSMEKFTGTVEGSARYGAMSAVIIFAILGFPFHIAPSAVIAGSTYVLYRGA